MTQTRVLYWLMLAAAPALSAQAPPVARIPDRVSCEACTIDLKHVVTLVASDGEGMLNAIPFAATTDRAGRYWVVVNGELPQLFSASGQFLRRFGGTGQGPGEFSGPINVISLPGDSMLVIDGTLQRATVVTPALHTGRTITLPFVAHPAVVQRWPDNVWMNNANQDALVRGGPLHRLNFGAANAELHQSFGPASEPTTRPGGNGRAQLIARGRDFMWAADKYQYRLTSWTPAGVARSVVERRPEWFATVSRAWIGNPTTPPPPVIAGIHEDSAGYMWVYISVPSPQWRAAWSRIASTRGDVPARQIAIENLWRSVIEVIDIKRGEVVARRFMDDWVALVFADGRVATGTVDASGIPRLTIASPSLRGR